MAIDMTLAPWNRLAKLAPPGTSGQDLQDAAQRYAVNADLNGALADLWEDAANAIDVTPPEPTPPTPGAIKSESVTQDGISRNVTYADTPVVNTHASRVAQQAAYAAKARQFRARAKPRTALLDGRAGDFFAHPVVPDQDVLIDPEIIIDVIP